MMTARTRRHLLVVSLLALPGCDRDAAAAPLFRLLSPEQTGVTFTNTITTTDAHNFHSNHFIYNGAGVAVGDIDGDGLPDIRVAMNPRTGRPHAGRACSATTSSTVPKWLFGGLPPPRAVRPMALPPSFRSRRTRPSRAPGGTARHVSPHTIAP